MSVQANSAITTQQLDTPTPNAVFADPTLMTQQLETIVQGGDIPHDISQVRSLKTPVDARPAMPQDPDYFEAIVAGRSFVLDNPVLMQWLNTPAIRKTTRVVYGLNQHGQRINGLVVTLSDNQTVFIQREDLTKQMGFRSAADALVTPLFVRDATGTLTQTPEGRFNEAFAPRAGEEYLPDVIDPDSPAVSTLVEDLRSQGRLRTGMTEEAVFSVVQAEMARRYQYQSDGDQDQWQSAHDTLQSGRGDCEDWSIAMASVLARALHVTGHSSDDVKLHIVLDGDQGHMIVEHAGLSWDSQQPNQVSKWTTRPVVTLDQSTIRVVDADALDSIIKSGTATDKPVQIYQKNAFEDRNDSKGLPLSFNELAYNTTNGLYMLMHGEDSEFKAVSNALVDGSVDLDLLKRFFEVQRQFDAMRSFFTVLMQCIQQRGKWIRLILAMIEGVDQSKDPSEHKYSFEGINFNQLTQSLVSLYVADIDSELSEAKAQVEEDHSNWWNTLENMFGGDESKISQEKKEQAAVQNAYNRVEALMLALSKNFEAEQSELSQLFGAMLPEASFKHTAEGADDELVDFGNSNTRSNTRSLSKWQETGNEKTIEFSDAKEQARPLFDIVETSLQKMMIRGKKLQAGIQLVAAALGFRANLQYAIQKITLGYGEFDTGVQAKIVAWRTSRYDLFESQFVDQLIKLKSLFDESANRALEIKKKEMLQGVKIAQNIVNVVLVPAMMLSGVGPVSFVIVNVLMEAAEFGVNYYFEEHYNKDPQLNTMQDEELKEFLEAEGIPTSGPDSVDANDQSVFSAWQAYERVRSRQGDVLRLSLSGDIRDKNGKEIHNVRWQTNDGSLKKLDALYGVYVSEALMESRKPMILIQQSWVQRALLMATILQFAIGFSISDKYANDNRAVAERIASLVDKLKDSIDREWENQAKEQAIRFEREQKKRQLLINLAIDGLKALSGLGLAKVKSLQNTMFFKVTKWHILYQHGLGSVASALKSMAPWFPWGWSDSKGKSLSDAHQKLSANKTTREQLQAQADLYEKQWQTARDYRKKIEEMMDEVPMMSKQEIDRYYEKLEDARLNEARAKAQYARHQANVYLADYRKTHGQINTDTNSLEKQEAMSRNTHTNVYGLEYKMVNRKAVFEKQEALSKLFKIYHALQAARMARYRIMDAIIGLSRGDRAAESVSLISMETDLINRHFDRLIQQAKEQMDIANKKTEAFNRALDAGIDLVITVGFMASLAFFQNPAMGAFLLFSKEMVGLLRSSIVKGMNNEDSRVHGDTRDLRDELIGKRPSGDSTTLTSAISPQVATQAPNTKSFEDVVRMQRGKTGEYYLNSEQVMQFNRQLAYTVQAMQLSAQAVSKIAELRYMIMNRMAGGTTSPTAVTGLMMGLNESVLQSYYAHRKALLETRASRETVANSLWQNITADSVHAGANVLSYLPAAKPLSQFSQTVKLARFGSAGLFRQLAEQNKLLFGKLNNVNNVSKRDDQHEKEATPKTQAAKKERDLFNQIQASSSRSVQGMAALYQSIKLMQYQHQYQQHRSEARSQYLKTVQEFLSVVGSSVSKTLKEKKIRDWVLQHTPRFMAQLIIAKGNWKIAAKNASMVPVPGPTELISKIRNGKLKKDFEDKSRKVHINSIAELFSMASSDQQHKYVKKLNGLLREQFSTSIERTKITDIIRDLSKEGKAKKELLQTLDMMQLMSQLPGDSREYIVSEKTMPSIDKLSKLMDSKRMEEALVYQRIAKTLSVEGNQEKLEEQINKFAIKAEQNLKKATQPKQQLAAVLQAMAVARVLGWIKLPANPQTPIVYSIIQQVRANGKKHTQRIEGLPRMNRKQLRIKRLDNQPNVGDELDGVLAYLGMEKPKPILDLKTISLDQLNALSSDELAVAIVQHAEIHGWENAGQVLTNQVKQEGLEKISWKDTLVAIRRVIDYNRDIQIRFWKTSYRFRSRQNDTNQKTSEFLVGVFGKPDTGLTEFDACLNSGVDNALAILTGLSPLNLSGMALTSMANRPNIQRYLQQLNNEALKGEIKARLVSRKEAVHPDEPVLRHVIRRPLDATLDKNEVAGWPGFINARFPSEEESENMGEYDLDLAES